MWMRCFAIPSEQVVFEQKKTENSPRRSWAQGSSYWVSSKRDPGFISRVLWGWAEPWARRAFRGLTLGRSKSYAEKKDTNPNLGFFLWYETWKRGTRRMVGGSWAIGERAPLNWYHRAQCGLDHFCWRGPSCRGCCGNHRRRIGHPPSIRALQSPLPGFSSPNSFCMGLGPSFLSKKWFSLQMRAKTHAGCLVN